MNLMPSLFPCLLLAAPMPTESDLSSKQPASSQTTSDTASDQTTSSIPTEPVSSIDEPIERKSLSPPAKEAWQQPGFRIFLGYQRSIGPGLNIDLSSDAQELEIVTGARLSSHWALMVQFRYGLINMKNDETTYDGFSYSGIVRAEYHFHAGPFLGFGLGFAGLGIDQSSSFGVAPSEQFNDLPATYTQLTTNPLVTSCTGTGLASQVLAGHRFFMNPMFAIGIQASAEYRQVMCFEDLGPENPLTGDPIGIRQLWDLGQASLALVIGFR